MIVTWIVVVCSNVCDVCVVEIFTLPEAPGVCRIPAWYDGQCMELENGHQSSIQQNQ